MKRLIFCFHFCFSKKKLEFLLFPVFLLFFSFSFSQKTFTRADSLRGSITPERAWWDVQHYDLEVAVHPEERFLSGKNTITYTVSEPFQIMQIDLQPPMTIEKAIQNNRELSFSSEGAAHFISLDQKQRKGRRNQITVYFSGKPKTAENAPWDGGFVWSKDSNGKYWIANANQGIGASIWWPLKDHPADEPDEGMRIAVTAPKDLMEISNGKLLEVVRKKTANTWIWEVKNPINPYGVNISIGDYFHWSETYPGLKGNLSLDFYVLTKNKEKGQKQFQEARRMLEAFEYWFGPYPFYEDGYKLIEVPYLGMEHQSAVTYGNNFENGYLGRDLSGSGWGMKFDFIIVHESAHEWFANNITAKDVADMWLHEGFTCYAENLFVDYFYGKEAASEYVTGLRTSIVNDRPIIGTYDVNHPGGTDMYYKGANILHTLRQLIGDDQKWREILRGLNQKFYHQTVTTAQVEKYISRKSGLNLNGFWDQYLRTVKIPVLEYSVEGNRLNFRYTNIIDSFSMPVVIRVNSEELTIHPSREWKNVKFDNPVQTVEVKKDFYIFSKKIN